jgi:hypothetical protein
VGEVAEVFDQDPGESGRLDRVISDQTLTGVGSAQGYVQDILRILPS